MTEAEIDRCIEKLKDIQGEKHNLEIEEKKITDSLEIEKNLSDFFQKIYHPVLLFKNMWVHSWEFVFLDHLICYNIVWMGEYNFTRIISGTLSYRFLYEFEKYTLEIAEMWSKGEADHLEKAKNFTLDIHS